MKKYLVTLNYDKKVSYEEAIKHILEYTQVNCTYGIITEDYHGNQKFHHHFLVGETDLPIKKWNYGEKND